MLFNKLKIIFPRIILKQPRNYARQRRFVSARWKEPVGEKTNIQIYNCVAKEKVPFIPQNKNLITWYTCGPTVYSPAHIGHACTYIRLDVIQNILKQIFNYNIVTVTNITDIDDKIIEKCSGTSIIPFTRRHELEFWDDMKKLGIKKPSIILRVTECIPQIINFIERLVKMEQAYVTQHGSVFFDLFKYSNYSKLQKISQEIYLTDPSEIDKKSPEDFVLWKAVKPDEPYWDSPWGPGRPGWHIECSVMGSIAFGNKIDIHAGGMDLRFPHHENEEAQSCCYHEVDQWVNYWVHTGSLNLPNTAKMSKSLGNTISISSLLDKYSANEFRIACLISHYRHRIEFSVERMQTATSLLGKFYSFFEYCEQFQKKNLRCSDENRNLLEFNLKHTHNIVLKAFEDDFDTPKVFKALISMVGFTYKTMNAPQSISPSDDMYTNIDVILATKNFILNILNVFGVNIDVKYEKEMNTSRFEAILNMCTEFRQNVRKIAIDKPGNTHQVLFNLCDKLREDLAKSGIQLRDEKETTSWIDYRRKS